MIAWLKRLIWSDGFSPSERAIFAYHDGTRKRWADPLEIQRELKKQGGDNWMESIPALSRGGGIAASKLSPELRKAVEDGYAASLDKLTKMVRSVFGLPMFGTSINGKPVGLTDIECIDLLSDFLLWLSTLEQEYRPFVNPPTVAPVLSEEEADWRTVPLSEYR